MTTIPPSARLSATAERLAAWWLWPHQYLSFVSDLRQIANEFRQIEADHARMKEVLDAQVGESFIALRAQDEAVAEDSNVVWLKPSVVRRVEIRGGVG